MVVKAKRFATFGLCAMALCGSVAHAKSTECAEAHAAFKAALGEFKTTNSELHVAKKEAIKDAIAQFKSGAITEEEKSALISAAVEAFETAKAEAEAMKDEAEAAKDAACEN